jgi:hypothetical protein
MFNLEFVFLINFSLHKIDLFTRYQIKMIKKSFILKNIPKNGIIPLIKEQTQKGE